MTEHPLHDPVLDLPGSRGPLGLTLPGARELAELVGAAQSAGFVGCQEKADGHWAAVHVDADGRVAAVDARSGAPLRVAAGWLGAELGAAWAGWVLVGEMIGGTPRARLERADDATRTDADGLAREYAGRPALVLFHAIDPEGGRHEARELGELPDGVEPIAEAPEGADWGAWALAVLERGGEGVVLRDQTGRLWRAKGRIEEERVVQSTRLHLDRHGAAVAELGLAVPARRRDRRRVLQWVVCPSGAEAPRLRGRIVTVRGSGLLEGGVVRDAVLVAVRADKRVRDL